MAQTKKMLKKPNGILLKGAELLPLPPAQKQNEGRDKWVFYTSYIYPVLKGKEKNFFFDFVAKEVLSPMESWINVTMTENDCGSNDKWSYQ